ncbi:fasciclin [Corynebacterium sphenisci DSM 44792]|uniref:Fasciclin n=1 Tax=Corynebacterium sphenisci DSM 44792 TaxID=1437874 RepID=A0A1L7CYT8_9CORY|nr:fasciclin domain-containing protein [Corynebacterium sphenisci]APT91055.1 fasciclin [Corynebacterium sphenisci DSM 44792]
MKITRRPLTAAALVAAALTMGACATDGDGAEETTAASTATSTMTGSESESADAGADGSGPAGPGCAAYAEAHPDGPASLGVIADQNIVEAVPNIPELSTLTAALTGGLNPDVNLVATLEGGEWTIFAPTDEAFAKVDDATIEKLKTDADLLSAVLTYHVVDGQAGLDMVDGEHVTVQGEKVTVTIDGEEMTVNDANIACGGITTANATVYLIDTVLLPPM